MRPINRRLRKLSFELMFGGIAVFIIFGIMGIKWLPLIGWMVGLTGALLYAYLWVKWIKQ